MPITVPRASVTEAADDLKARDALLRGFPEVESVIGKAGRADTPTDPAPLDMVETFVNFRPKELWPKRVLRFEDAKRQTEEMLTLLEQRGFVLNPAEKPGLGSGKKADDARESLINDATQRALETFDREMRELALKRYQQFEQRLSVHITRFAIEDFLRLERDAGWLKWPHGTGSDGTTEAQRIDELTDRFAPEHGRWLALNPTREEVGRLLQRVAHDLNERGALDDLVGAMEFKERGAARLWSLVVEAFGGEHKPLAAKLLQRIERKRLDFWRDAVATINWELFDRGVEAYCRHALEELAQGAKRQAPCPRPTRETDCQRLPKCRSMTGQSWATDVGWDKLARASAGPPSDRQTARKGGPAAPKPALSHPTNRRQQSETGCGGVPTNSPHCWPKSKSRSKIGSCSGPRRGAERRPGGR